MPTIAWTPEPRGSIDTRPESQQALAADLLDAHRKAVKEHEARGNRLEQAGRHLIVSAWNAGLSENRISEILGLTRPPIHARLVEAQAAGQLRRPLGSRSSRDGVVVFLTDPRAEAGASADAVEG